MTTGKGTLIGVRLLDDPLSTLDAWIAKQKETALSRPEAIRRLVEIGLKAEKPSKATRSTPNKLRAQELAAKTIERLADPTAPPEERAQRRRRLTKGPTEFREHRVDLPKAKGK